MGKTLLRVPIRLLGIPLYLDLTLLLILPVLAFLIGRDLPLFVKGFALDVNTASIQTGWTPYLLGLLSAVGLFLSVLVHELGHCVVGKHYGLRIRRITLWILGGMAQFEKMPRRRGEEAIMAAAGPLTSLLLGGACALIYSAIPQSLSGIRFIFAYLMITNVMLAFFNLLPAIPLDGGRVLRSLLAMRMPYLAATQVAANISKVLAILLGLFGLISNLWLTFIAFFIYVAVTGESQYVTVSEMLRGIAVEDLMSSPVKSVRRHESAADLLHRMFLEHHLCYPVLDEFGKLIGMVTLQQLQQAKAEGKNESQTTVAEIMSREIQTISRQESALEAFRLISQSPLGRLAVVDSMGTLVGIISKTDLVRTVQLRMVQMDADNLKSQETASY